MLQVKNLSCGYGKKIILRDVTFQVKEGEVLGIIGPNGSGKTTLLRAITKVINPSRGEITLKGKNVGRMDFQEFAKTAAVVSQTLPGGFVTLEEFVLLGRTPYFKRFQFFETENDLRVAQKAMMLTDTWGLKDRFLEEMSGGEKQLSLIARALSQEPSLLFLDEPTSHLDIAHQVYILDLIRRLNKELSLTVVMVMHDLNLAAEYCDRLLLLREGRVHCAGYPKEVLTYQTIEEVYRTVVVVTDSPVSGKPHIFVVPSEQRHNP
ncbi:MAG: ABC transporter ATP-binding protein [Candidatus Omnitrophica bacterium]|nr:ABC transporter ATP-binding protein [Candidatus Omnitrophota bacterium]